MNKIDHAGYSDMKWHLEDFFYAPNTPHSSQKT